MNLLCLFGLHRWKRVFAWRWHQRQVWFTSWGTDKVTEVTLTGGWWDAGRICADCRKREVN